MVFGKRLVFIKEAEKIKLFRLNEIHDGCFCVINMLDESLQKVLATFSFQKPFYKPFFVVVEANNWIEAKADIYYPFCSHAPLPEELFICLACFNKTVFFSKKKAPVTYCYLDRYNTRQNYSSHVLVLRNGYKHKSISCKCYKCLKKWLVNIGEPRRCYNQQDLLHLMSVPGDLQILRISHTSLTVSYVLIDSPNADRLQLFRNRPDVRLSYNRIWLPSLGTRGQGV